MMRADCIHVPGIVDKCGNFLFDPLIECGSHALLAHQHNITTPIYCNGIYATHDADQYCQVEIEGKDADLDSYHLEWGLERKPCWWNSDWDSEIEVKARQMLAPFVIDGNLVRGPVEDGCRTKRWYVNKVIHRIGAPAIEYLDGDNEWRINGELHRDDGPAFTYGGRTVWYQHGLCHRVGGPAFVFPGTECWFKDGLIHRDGGPAQVNIDGTQVWKVNGQYHRLDGPARIGRYGLKEWWIDGVQLTEEQFNSH
jgi:hypothetical protein